MAASSAFFIRWFLVFGALLFFLAQIRMFVYQTECADRVQKALEGEGKWIEVSKKLKQNLTEAYEEITSLKEKLIIQSRLLDVKQTERETETKQKEERILKAENEPEKATPPKKNLPPGLRELPPRLKKVQRPGGDPVSPADKATHIKVEKAGPLNFRKNLREKPKVTHVLSLSTPTFSEADSVVAAVVVLACNRPDYLKRTLSSILKHHDPTSGKFPLYISQDGKSEEVKAMAQSFPQFIFMQHIEEKPPVMSSSGENIAYYRIAEHYRWALTQLFSVLKFPRVIILEDDMELAPDFFHYFEATANLLDVDESLLAVSSWNDNGQEQFVEDEELLYRSDFFPGLGWMLKSSLWEELAPKWPKAYWDDWLRLKANRRGRQTIRPEVCRTYNFGEHGSSMGQFFQTYLAPIKLSSKEVNWPAKDLSYLLNTNYLDFFTKDLQAAVKAPSAENVVQRRALSSDVILEYKDESEFRGIAQQLGIFEEWKDGVPRTAYMDVVTIRFHGSHRVYIIGPKSAQLLTYRPKFS